MSENKNNIFEVILLFTWGAAVLLDVNLTENFSVIAKHEQYEPA